jgi:spore germination protein KC
LNKVHVWIKVGLILIGIILISGCWDVQEIKSRGIANAVFFDLVEENPKNPGASGLKMGVALSVPGSLAPTNVGTYQQFNKRNFVITGTGDSIVNAWTEIQANAERDIFFGQMRAVILSERLAHENINNYLDFIGRIPLAPPNVNVLVAKDDPEKLLDLKNQPNELPGNYIDYYFRSPSKRSLAIPVDLWRINAIMDRKTGDPYIPVFEEWQGSSAAFQAGNEKTQGSNEKSQGDNEKIQESYKIAGTAVFSRNRLAGQLSMDETITLSMMKGTDNGYLTVPLGKPEYVAFKNIRSQTKIQPKMTAGGVVTFSVKTTVSGNMVENMPHRETWLKEKRRIERQVGVFIQRRIRDLIAKLQGFNSDPVEFGRKLWIKYPHPWKQIDWHKVYPAAKFNVSAKFTLKETGLFR